MRRIIRILACAWLVCHATALVAAPLSICSADTPAATHQKKCCPGLKPGDVCPMHHTREGDDACVMRSACGRVDAALLTLSTGIATLPHFTAVVVPFGRSSAVAPFAGCSLSRTIPPESPPPRI